MKKILTKKKVIISSIVALLLIGGAYNATRPVDSPVGVSEGSTSDDSKKDEPILVKDPETGETKAVTKEEIKNNPSLAKNVIVSPTKSDYSSAGVSAPSDPKIYNCIKEIYEVDGTVNVIIDLGGSYLTVNPDLCKTITTKKIPKQEGYKPPVIPETQYASSTYQKSYAEWTGNCLEPKRDLGLGSSRQKLEFTFKTSTVPDNYPTNSNAPYINSPDINLTLNDRCEKWEVYYQSNRVWNDLGWGTKDGVVQYLGGYYSQYTVYHNWRYTQENRIIQRTVSVCTVDGTAHYKESISGDACTNYKSSPSGWSLTKI